MKFTQSVIDKGRIDTGGKADFIAWDNELPGFGLRIREGGSRNYIVQYKIGDQQRRKTLGSTKELTLNQARTQAKKDLGKVANGEDPQAEKAAARATAATDTFAEVAERFLKYQAGHLRPSSLYATTNYLTNYCKRLRALKVDTITKREIASVVSSVAENHGKVAADRCGSAISSLFAWSVNEGLVERNPAIGLNKHAGPTSRNRVLNDKELARVWLAAGDSDYGRILKLLILTGQRRDEIAGLHRGEIVGNAIELPSERTKNHRPHIVPLVDAARDLIGDGDREVIFGRHGRTGFSGFSKAKREIDAKLKGMEPWTVHDIRRSVATGMAELGVEPHVIEAVLNHVSGHRSGVAGVYNKATYLEAKTKALELWAKHIAVIVAQASGANVSRLTDRSRTLARTGRIS